MNIETQVKELGELQARQKDVLEHKGLSSFPSQPEREIEESEPVESPAMGLLKGALLYFVGWLITCVLLWHGAGLLWSFLSWSGLLGLVIGIILLVLSLRAVVDMLWD